MLGEHAAGIVLDFTEGDGFKSAGALKSKAKSPNRMPENKSSTLSLGVSGITSFPLTSTMRATFLICIC